MNIDGRLHTRDDRKVLTFLAEHFLSEYAKQERKTFDGFSREAAAAIVAYEWPGNVRELQNVIRNMVVMNPGGEIGASALPPQIATLAPNSVASGETGRPAQTAATLGSGTAQIALPSALDEIRPLEDIERDAIEHAIEICDGNIRMAATYLEVSPATIYRKRAKWDESPSA